MFLATFDFVAVGGNTGFSFRVFLHRKGDEIAARENIFITVFGFKISSLNHESLCP